MKSTKPIGRAKKKPMRATRPETPAATNAAENLSEAELQRSRLEAKEAVRAIQEDSVARGLDAMTMEEIDATIAEVRRSSKR